MTPQTTDAFTTLREKTLENHCIVLFIGIMLDMLDFYSASE